MTNGDRIRAMADEELAAMASRRISCVWCPVNGCYEGDSDECIAALLAWLRSPVEDAE